MKRERATGWDTAAPASNNGETSSKRGYWAFGGASVDRGTRRAHKALPTVLTRQGSAVYSSRGEESENW